MSRMIQRCIARPLVFSELNHQHSVQRMRQICWSTFLITLLTWGSESGTECRRSSSTVSWRCLYLGDLWPVALPFSYSRLAHCWKQTNLHGASCCLASSFFMFVFIGPTNQVGWREVLADFQRFRYQAWIGFCFLFAASVTLDPNTAHSQLRVSDDLTAVEHRKQELLLPDNPERFDSVTCVLGCEGFNSGSHCWDVEVGDSNVWELGVIRESAPRKKNSFYNAVCSMSYNKGSYHTLRPGQAGDMFRAKDKPQKVRVHLEWDKGSVTFTDLLTSTHLHTITHTFTERVFPFFYNGSPSRPLKILPMKPTVTVKTFNL